MITFKYKPLILYNISKLYFFDWIKYDFKFLKLPVSLAILIISLVQYQRKKYLNAVELLGSLFRTGWLGSEKLPTIIIKTILHEKNKDIMAVLVNDVMKETSPHSGTARFFNDPSVLFESNIIIIRKHTEQHKGIIIIKYSYYFSFFFKLFDMESIIANYHIVLEPSWAGFCDPNILIFATLNQPVFIMSYEDRDRKFLESINTNLIPINTGSNWWVDYRTFNCNEDIKRNIDILVISKWSKFKRYYFIFKAISNLRKIKNNISVAIVGYPGDQSLSEIKSLIKYFNLTSVIDIYESISPDEVAELLCHAKINLLWSRFEGDKRSIVEGMFCNTPCVLREGNNYGQKYTYINSKTGEWANEKNLTSVLSDMLNNEGKTYAPREYVMKKHNCHIGIQILSDSISLYDNKIPSNTDGIGLETKINELHGMRYFNKDARSKFQDDYNYLLQNIKKGNKKS